MANTNIFNLAGIGSNVLLGKGGPRIKNNAGVLEIRNTADTAYSAFKAGSGEFTSDVTVQGNLTVNGTTTSVNSSTTQIEDPVIILGAGPNGAALATTDVFNRGVNFVWYNAATSTSTTGFFGWDNASGNFAYRPDGVNLGTAEFSAVIAGDVTISGDMIQNGSGDLTVAPAGDLILTSLGTTSALLFGDASQKIKSSTITWNSATDTLGVNGLVFSGSTISTAAGDLTLSPASGKVIVSSLTAGQVTFAGADKELVGASTFTFNSGTGLLSVSAVATTSDVTVGGNLTVSTLTAGQVPYVGTAGLISNSAAFTWNNATATLAATNITSTGTANLATVNVSTLTAGRLTFAGTAGLLSDSASLTFAGTTLSVPNVSSTNLTASSLTAGRVTFAGAAGLLVDNSAFTFDAGSATLTATNVTSSGTADLATVTVSTLTSGRITFAGAAGLLSDASTLAFDATTGTVTTTNVTATAAMQAASFTNTSLTAGRIVFSTTGGLQTDDANLTYAAGVLTVGLTQISSGSISTTAGNLTLNPNSGVIDSSGARYTNAADPIAAQDLVTKAYLDTQVGTGSKIASTVLGTAASYTQTITGSVHRIKVYVQTAYSANAEISISDGSTTVMAQADSDCATTGCYIVDMFSTYSGATFTLNIAGAPSVGAGQWLTEYFTTAA